MRAPQRPSGRTLMSPKGRSGGQTNPLTQQEEQAFEIVDDLIDLGPGSRGSDARRIQRAIDALSLDRIANGRDPGGTVRLAAGTYGLERALTLRSHVTLQGGSLVTSVLTRVTASPIPMVRLARDAEGSTLENLTIDGGVRDHALPDPGDHYPGLVLLGSARFCTVRRCRIRHTAGDGLRAKMGRYEQLYLDELWIERCGRHGLAISADRASRGLFLSAISVGEFGATTDRPTAGLVLQARAHVSQLSIDPVRSGQTGVQFGPNSEYTTVSPYFLGVDAGGRAFAGLDHRAGIVVGTGTVQEEGRVGHEPA